MNGALRRFLTIVVGSTVCACLLGICVDLVTAHVAVEYFSVHHPRTVAAENPLILAGVWGIAASWWLGVGAGIVVALVNQRRKQPLAPSRILTWNALACVVLWTTMMAILVAVLAVSSMIPIEKRPASFESDRRLVAVAMAHQYEYALGGIAIFVVAIATWRAKPAGPPASDEDSKATGSKSSGDAVPSAGCHEFESRAGG